MLASDEGYIVIYFNFMKHQTRVVSPAGVKLHEIGKLKYAKKNFVKL